MNVGGHQGCKLTLTIPAGARAEGASGLAASGPRSSNESESHPTRRRDGGKSISPNVDNLIL